MTSPRTRRVVEPVALDLRQDNATLRGICVSALRRTLSPTLALYHHGCERLCRRLAEQTRAAHAHEPTEPQVARELDEPAASELRAALREIAWRVLEIALGDDARAALEEGHGKTLHSGRLCMREYASGEVGGSRLGAHCDATLLTLLWADGPGLEVFAPPADQEAHGGWSGKQVRAVTRHSVGSPPRLQPTRALDAGGPVWPACDDIRRPRPRGGALGDHLAPVGRRTSAGTAWH